MVKKGATSKKKTSTKKKVKKTTSKNSSVIKNKQIEKVLIENFIALQKVMVNLSTKFDSLGTQMSNLLNLFEESAKALAQKEFDLEKENLDHKKILDQIDSILDQNKTIARGLTLMHETPRGETEQTFSQHPLEQPLQKPPIQNIPPRQPFPTMQNIPLKSAIPQQNEQYQKSISDVSKKQPQPTLQIPPPAIIPPPENIIPPQNQIQANPLNSQENNQQEE